MRKFFAIFAIFAISAGAAVAEMSLAEKIKLAKKIADAAAQGREDSGLVVGGGGADLSKLAQKYRDFATDDSSALPEVEPAQPDEIAQPQPVEVARLQPAAVAEEASAKPPVAASEEKAVAAVPEKKPAAEIRQPRADKTPAPEAPQPVAQAPKSSEAAAEPQPEILPPVLPEKNIPKNKNPAPKYVVDTSDFINGHYVPNKSELPEIPQPEAQIVQWSNGAFHLVGESELLIGKAQKVLDAAVAQFADYESGGLEKLKFSDKIAVQLVGDPKKAAEISPYAVDKSGSITITVLWDESLEFPYFCKLVSGALFRKLLLVKYGKTVRQCPVWLDEAFSVALQCRVKSGRLSEIVETAIQTPPRPLRDILGIEKIASVSDSADCFWALRSIERLTARTGKFIPTLAKISQLEPDSAFAEIEKTSPKNFSIRWNCTVCGEIYSRAGGVRSTKTSREDIMRLAYIQAEDISGEPVGLNPSQVWQFRDNKIVRFNLERRLAEIKIIFPRTNPLYAQTLVELGRILEAALEDDSDEYEDASAAFAENLARADALAETARKMLAL